MDGGKRGFLAALAIGAIGVPLAAIARAAFGQQGLGTRPVEPGGIVPERSEPPVPVFDPKKIVQHNQKVILDDVHKLYKLAGELKDQVEKTDSTSELSLSMVQKAKQVEKLAKQIANLAVG